MKNRGWVLVAALGMVAGTAGRVEAQDAAVPVEREPNHRTVFKNEWIQVFRVKLAPGQASLMHIHAHDDGAVRLDSSTSTGQPLGQAEMPPSTSAPGNVSARTNEPTPTIHRVRNIGATQFDVVDVQALARPEGPEVPALMTPAAENPRMRVYRYELAPGARLVEHTHTRPYLLVAATPIQLTTTAAGHSRQTALKVGEFRWVAGTAAHTLGNGGTEKGIVVEFELR